MRSLSDISGFPGADLQISIAESHSLAALVSPTLEAIVEYPESKALLRIASTPEFHEIERHRLAGLEGQLNITCEERPLGA